MTDERAVRDNADEIQDEGQSQGDQGQLEQEAVGPPGEASPRGARSGDEGARLLRRVLQLEPAGVRRRPLELLVPHGGSGHRRYGAREGLLVRLAGRALPLAREPGPAAAVPGAGEIRQVQGERRRWKAPLTVGCSGRPPGRSSRPIWSPSSWPSPCSLATCRSR